MLKDIIGIIRKNRMVQALMLALLAVAVLDAGFYFVKAEPAAARAGEFRDKLDTLKRQIKSAEDELRVYESFDEGRAQVESFKLLLPQRSEYTDVITKVYNLAKKDGMQSTAFGAETKAVLQAGDLAQLSFTLPVSGSYKNVRKFIYDIETSDLFLNISNLGLAKGGEKGDINLSIGLSTYVRS